MIKIVQRHIIPVALLFSLVGCVNDYSEKDPQSRTAELKLDLFSPSTYASTENGTSAENRIDNLTVMVFNHSTGNLEFSTRITNFNGVGGGVDMSGWSGDKVIKILDQMVLAKASAAMDIHVVANVDAGKLSSVGTLSALRAVLQTTITPNVQNPIVAPFVMHGSVDNHVFVNTRRAVLQLKRAIAKVRINLNTQSFVLDGHLVDLCPDGNPPVFRAMNATDRGWIVGDQFNSPEAQYINYSSGAFALTGSGMSDDLRTGMYGGELYAHENICMVYGNDNEMSVLVKVPYLLDGVLHEDNYYRIPIAGGIVRNTIYDVTVNIGSLGGPFDNERVVAGAVVILPWDESGYSGIIKQVYIAVNKTVVDMRAVDAITYSTNATSFSASSAASWLTASVTDPNTVSLTSDNSGYTVPRSTTVDLKGDFLTKTITVNQKAVYGFSGDFFINPRRVFVYNDGTQVKSDVATLTSNSGGTAIPWKRLDANNTTASIALASSGSGSVSNFVCSAGTVLGNTTFRVLNLNDLTYDTLQVCNLKLDAPESIIMGGRGGSQTADDVKAIGGDGTFTVTGNTSGGWLTTSFNGAGQLALTAEKAPTEDTRTCTITIAHTNDPNYTKTITIIQDTHMIISDPFDYFVINFVGARGQVPGDSPLSMYNSFIDNYNTDIDIGVGVSKNGFTGIDGKYLGYSAGNDGTTTYSGFSTAYPVRKYNSNYIYMTWGTDDVNVNDGETVFIDPTVVLDVDGNTGSSLIPLPSTTPKQAGELGQYVYIFCYAGWHTSTTSTHLLTIGVRTFTGGHMAPWKRNPNASKATNFENYIDVGNTIKGTPILSDSTRMLVKTKTSGADFSTSDNVNNRATNYTAVCLIRYDRIRHTVMFRFPNAVKSGNTYTYNWDNIPDDWKDYQGNKIKWPATNENQ